MPGHGGVRRSDVGHQRVVRARRQMHLDGSDDHFQFICMHPLVVADHSLGARVLAGHESHVVAASYSGHAQRHITFCRLRNIVPFPADGVTISVWIHWVTCTVAPSSLKMYLAAVRSAQLDRDIPWAISGDESVRRTRRYVIRRFSSGGKALKIPISLNVLRVILPLLPGWPALESMSHAHRMFATASVLAVMAFLRCGVFLSSSSQRDILPSERARHAGGGGGGAPAEGVLVMTSPLLVCGGRTSPCPPA